MTIKNQASITVGDLALDTADQTYTYPAALLQKTAGEMKKRDSAVDADGESRGISGGRLYHFR